MKNKTGFILTFFSALLISNLANADPNLIQVTTAETSGYETFSTFVLQNSIKKKSPSSTTFNLLLTGVSTTETSNNYDTTPVSDDERIDEYDLENSRIILSVNMNCKTKTTKVEKILSIDPESGKLKEQPNSENKQDVEMNNALYKIICK